MTNYQKWEADGRFGLSWRQPVHPWNSSFGTGGYEKTAVFGTAEGRDYFIHAREFEEAHSTVHRELLWFKQELLNCFTPSGRVRRKRLMQLAGRKV